MKEWTRQDLAMRPIHVVALGGSLLRPEETAQRDEWFSLLRQIAMNIEGKGHALALVVGGGKPARDGIEAARVFSTQSDLLDTIGIAATRLNATIIQQLLLAIGCDVSPMIPTNIDDAKQALQTYSILVMGGTQPGHTTDTVAVSLAASVSALQCIIATNVSHVYDQDPRQNPNAMAFTEMTIQELAEITGLGVEAFVPGASSVVDPIAVQTAMNSQLNLAVLDGRNLILLQQALEGAPFEGTRIKSR